MHKDNSRFGIYDNEGADAQNWVPELDVGASKGFYDNLKQRDRSLSAASSLHQLFQPLKFRILNWPKRRPFIALGAGILIVVVIVIIMLAATGCFYHGKSKLLQLVLKIKLFSIIKSDL